MLGAVFRVVLLTEGLGLSLSDAVGTRGVSLLGFDDGVEAGRSKNTPRVTILTIATSIRPVFLFFMVCIHNHYSLKFVSVKTITKRYRMVY